MKDKFRGSLIGGALGDALGYEIEFIRWASIKSAYGPNGIEDLNMKRKYDIAVISDDTQMTLFTAEGLIEKRDQEGTLTEQYIAPIWKAYKDWYATQDFFYQKHGYETDSWLCTFRQIFASRAPGNTCLSALSRDSFLKGPSPVNHSKGCGGVMRVAPIGLFFNPAKESSEEIVLLGADTTKLTHGHPLGYIPSAALVDLVNRITYTDTYGRHSLEECVNAMIANMKQLYQEESYIEVFTELMEQAVELSHKEMDDHDAILALGEGWVAEEALAIAVYCALKYQDDFRKAIQCSVNHDGDSDSTGAICGNILGAHLGFEKIRDAFDLEQLELCDVILQMSDKLYEASLR